MKQYIKKETRLADFDPCPRFIWNEGLSSLAISVYTLLLGRVSLSKQNDMIDEQGRVYVIYTVKHMAEKLSRSEPPIYAALKMLEEKGLIERKSSGKGYYDEVNYMNLRVLGTLGLTDDDLADIAKTDGVKAVYGGKTVEVLHDIGESEQVVKLIALTDGVNEPRVVEGRMPEKEDEILVDTQFLKSSGCEIGDQVTFTSGTEDPLSDSLTGDTFTIVGSATLPYYMDLNRGTGSIGNGSINSFALLLPETFTSDLYTEIYVQADGAQEEASYSDAYDETVKAVQTKIEALEDAACDRRYTAVKTEGQEKIDDAKQQVADAEQKLADAKTELDDGAQQLAAVHIICFIAQ